MNWHWQPLPPLAAPAATVALDDGGDGWQRSLANVAVGIALALGAATTAIAVERGVRPHQDEVAFPRVAEDPHIQYQIVDESGVFYVSDSDEQIVPQPATPALEESEWQPRSVLAPFVVQWTQPWNDELPVQLGEETWQWPVVEVQAPTLVQAAVDDEIVPQPAPTLNVDEEPATPQWVVPETVWAQVFSADDEWVPLAALDEQTWTPGWAEPERVALRIFSSDDEIVPQPAALGVDEDYYDFALSFEDVVSYTFYADDGIVTPRIAEEDGWWPRQPQPVAPVLQLWATNEEWVAPPAATLGVDEEGYFPRVVVQPDVFLVESFSFETSALDVEESEWRAPFVQQVAPTLRIWYGDEELSTPFVPLGIDDSDWKVPQPALVPPTLRVWWGEDETPTPPTGIGFDEEGYTPRVVSAEGVFLAESFSFETSSLSIDEGDWRAPFVQQVAPTLRVWWGDEERPTPPAALGIDEESWIPTAPVVKPVLRSWATDDDWVTPFVPLPIEETELPITARFCVPAPTMGLYLPDPEQAPAGSLVEPPKKPVAQKFKGKGYRPDFRPNLVDTEAEPVPEPQQKLQPVAVDFAAVVHVGLSAGAVVSFGVVEQAVITLPAPRHQFSTGKHAEEAGSGSAFAMSGGTTSAHRMHEIGINLNAMAWAETEYTSAMDKPLTDEEIAALLGKLV